MSTYAQPSDLVTRFGATEIAQRTDRGMPRLLKPELVTAAVGGGDLSGFSQAERDRAAASLVILGRVLQDADDTINSYVSARYVLPLSQVPQILQRLACDLARYYLYDDAVTETIQKRFDTATAMLKQVATGVLSLGVDGQTGQAPVSEAGAEIVTQPRVWDRSASKGFM